jgi:tetratricopeptide (TPR) repeat protein
MQRRSWSLHICLSLVILAAAAFNVTAQQAASGAGESGWDALDQGDGEKAALAFNRALAEHPRDPALLFGAGAAAHLAGRGEAACEFLRKALQIEPRLTAASVLLGQIAYDVGDVAAAIRTYEEALVHAPRQRILKERLDAWRSEANKTTYVSGPYTIMFEGHVEARLAAHATAILDAAYWRIARTIGAYPSTPITVILYTEQEFHDVTGAPEWSDGSFDTRIRIPVRGALRTTARFDRVLTHELAHAMIASLAPRGVPAWLHEGLAVNLEPGDVNGAEQRLKALRTFVPLEQLQAGFGRFNDVEAGIAYDVSTVAARALMSRLGTRIALLLGELDRGSDFAVAAARFGIQSNQFEDGLSRTIRQP